MSEQRWDFDDAQAGFDERLETAGQALGLTVRRFVLKSLPTNVHWHFGIEGTTGTLEATWLIDSQTAWLSVRSNRNAEWVDGAVVALLRRLANR